MSTGVRDPITTHVLDSTTGLPAKSIRVTLTLLSHRVTFPNTRYTALTSTDGRISQWTPQSVNPLPHILPEIAQLTHRGQTHSKKMVWSLKFETEAYWGTGKTFYPEVEVRFFVDVEEALEGKGHWHVPVLLGPWSYTTYKGS
ncbi:hypothetical protein MMC26_004444 [Xylographa opegraphella]|nr:hypothetical protein [Xylographa opegraphella]